MKEISGAKKFKLESFPKKLKIKETEITKAYEITNEHNTFFTGIGKNLASSVTNNTKSFKTT